MTRNRKLLIITAAIALPMSGNLYAQETQSEAQPSERIVVNGKLPKGPDVQGTIVGRGDSAINVRTADGNITTVNYDQNTKIKGSSGLFGGGGKQTSDALMAGLPVTVRLLDPPLHEFLPHSEEEFESVADAAGATVEVLKRRVAELDDEPPVAWRHRDERYAEKLATPDTSVADLVGDIDPMKVAEGRSLGDPETIHFGLVPRAHRGIVAINELPDLAERIQVSLLNVMEERDIQVRGYTLRLPLDVLLVASANPEDYTNRGRIITPLKDRFGAEVRTHYPVELAEAIEEADRG